MSKEQAIKDWGSWQVGVMERVGVEFYNLRTFQTWNEVERCDTVSDAITKLCAKIERLECEISFLARSNSQNDVE